MTKKDLKTGMIVQLRDGSIFLIINDVIVQVCGYDFLDNYKDDLSNVAESKFDIVKVSNVLDDYLLKPENWTEETLNDNLLWKRDEYKEYTMLELENLLGHKIKIKK